MPALLPFLALLLLSVLPAALAREAPSLQIAPFLSGLEAPVALADDGTGRLVIAEQRGTLRIVVNGQLRSEPCLDLRDRVKSGGERGLLSVVFHPRYKENGRLFVNYTTTRNGPLETVVAEFHAPARALKVDPATEKVVLRFRQPYSNHNGGQLAFGPDGMLYIATGDGGSGGDPQQHGQNLETLLGKILRIDVDRPGEGETYSIPADNPFVGTPNARPEIWDYGLRNPWRFSFDRKTGLLWTGDVGQNHWEEIDIVEKGKNYGWSAREGTHDFKPERGNGPMVDPVKEYGRSEGQSVTGGYVYRGEEIPALQGIYLYADFLSGNVWGLECAGNGQPVTFDALLFKAPFNISSFGEDHTGALYLLDYGGGRVLRVIDR